MDVKVSIPPALPARDEAAHKGDFGRVLLIGGSRGMAGAISLAGMAALRSGAGLVTLAIGLITSMFTAVFVTRAIVVVWLRQRRPKAIPI